MRPQIYLSIRTCLLIIATCSIQLHTQAATGPRADIPQRTLAKGDQGPDVVRLHNYLTKYGYFPNDDLRVFKNWRPALANRPANPSVFDDITEQAMRLFQRAQGLRVDGTLNKITLELIKLPRCGVPDIPPVAKQAATTSGQFVAQGNSWTNSNLTYSFDNFISDTTQDAIRGAVMGALNQWASQARLAFMEIATQGDIQIGWFSGSHPDGSTFDGPGGTLAHAFYPSAELGQFRGGRPL